MAATNYTPISLYYTTTAAAVPLAANLVNGELAINITDGKLFYKDSGGNVQVIATKGAGTIGGSNTQVQYNNNGALAGSANLTFNGTTLTAAGLAGPLNGTVGATTPNTGAFTTLTASGGIEQYKNANSISYVRVANDSTGAAADSYFYAQNSATTLFMGLPSTGFTTSGLKVAGQAYIYHDGAGGLSIGATNGAGALRFYTGGTTERMRLNASGHLGIGVTPDAGWQATSGVIQFGAYGSGAIANITNTGNLYIGTNWYYDGTNYRYLQTGVSASQIQTYGAGVAINVAGSGTAGNVISFSNPATFTSTGLAVTGTGGGAYVGQFANSNSTSYGLYVAAGGGGSRQIAYFADYAGAVTMNVQSGSVSVTGALSCTGALSKGSGSFRITHPLPQLSETHQLVHSFIEGPKADLIYRGKVNLVNGAASVNIDAAAGMTEGTFVVLCRDVQCFTTNESDWTPVRGSVSGNVLTIEAQDNMSAASVSWMVIGERKDQHMYDTDWTDDDGHVIVEPLKPVVENQEQADAQV